MRNREGALDGLRALALLAVLLYHALPDSVSGGFLGVDVFFVLSGYLLTSILLREHRERGALDYRRYASRRLRRIAPGLLALLAALVLAVPFVARDDAHRLVGDLYSSLGGVTNWHLVISHSSYFGGLGRPPFVRHLWSLSIEIQFYLLCPFLVSWLARRRLAVAVSTLSLGIVTSAALMTFLYRSTDPSRAYYGTDTRVGALLIGTLLAVVLATYPSLGFPSARVRAIAGGGALVVLVAMFAFAVDTSRWMYPDGFFLAEAATAVLIAVVREPGPLRRGLGIRPLRWLGERSYGAYLWHWPLVVLLRPRVDVTWSPLAAAAVTIGAAILLGHVSYVLLERPLLRPMPRPGRVLLGIEYVLTGVAAVGIAMMVTDLPRTDPIVTSLRAGEAAIAHQAPTTVATTTTSTIAATTTTAATPATRVVSVASAPLAAGVVGRPGPAPGTVNVSAIGDSVMLGAAPQLQARFGATGYIDAKIGRQFGEGPDVARQMRSEGRLGDVAIVHLGTNGPPRSSQIDALMAALHDVRRVLFVTVRMPRSWEASTNDTLRAGASRYGNVSIVDWHGYSDAHTDWFESDGIHLRPRGAQAYAELLDGALPGPPPPPTTTTEPPTTTTEATTTTTESTPISVPTG